MLAALFVSGASAESEETDYLENSENASFGELFLGSQLASRPAPERPDTALDNDVHGDHVGEPATM